MTHPLPETMRPVVSSNVDSVGRRDNHLYVKFKSGGTYRWPNAADEHHDALISAESPGRYLRHTLQVKGERVE